MELLTLCRSCMVEVASWELQNFDGDAVEMFTYCTNVQVSGDDKLPKQFCCDCKIKIESCFTFIKKAQEVNVILKNMLSSSESSVIVKSENLTNDLQLNESNLLEPDSFSFEDKIDKNEEKPFSPDSNQSIEYKMKFDIYQTSPKNSENELDESAKEIDEDRPKVQEKKGDNTHRAVKICDICDRTFKSNLQFSRHMEQHSEPRHYLHVCTMCGKAFKTKSILASHMYSHENEKQFLCGLCGFSTKLLDILNGHMLTHTGEKPYTCRKCSYRAKTRNQLQSHEVRRHSGERAHACQRCGKRFHELTGLARHIRQVHSGESYSSATCAPRPSPTAGNASNT